MLNSGTYINFGQEVSEIQPMNTGVYWIPDDIYTLDKNNPYYCKLALFDKFSLHFAYETRWDIPNSLKKVSSIRNKCLKYITNLENYDCIHLSKNLCVGFSYFVNDNSLLLIISNLDPHNSNRTIADISSIASNRNISLK